MRTFKKELCGLLVLFVLGSTSFFGQEKPKEEFQSVFLTATTVHRSTDPNVDFTDWLKTEKEYFDKVTSKNDLLIGSGYYSHYFTPDNSEMILVSVYKTWEDIDKANEVTNKLIEEGWPDETARKAFFDKQNSYYSPSHSDEIYQTMPFTIPVKTDSKKPLIYYVKRNSMGLGGSGFKEYFENVTQKNKYIKGYYTHRHLYGANSRDAMEVFVFDKLGDIERSFDENTRLEKEHWADEAKAKEFFEGYSKMFTKHGDYVYHNVPELQK
jgi:hypothetical protein